METKTIQSWRHKNVRVKEEYIVKEKEIDEDASTYDDDYKVIDYLDKAIKKIHDNLMVAMEND